MALPDFPRPELNGAGATFPYPIYSKWFNEYHNAAFRCADQLPVHRQRRRDPPGTAGTVDFGASDGPMTDEQLHR